MFVRNVRYIAQDYMEFDVRVSVHQSKILTEKPNNMQQCIKIFIIPHFI